MQTLETPSGQKFLITLSESYNRLLLLDQLRAEQPAFEERRNGFKPEVFSADPGGSQAVDQPQFA